MTQILLALDLLQENLRISYVFIKLRSLLRLLMHTVHYGRRSEKRALLYGRHTRTLPVASQPLVRMTL